MIRVEFLAYADRAALCEMLEDEEGFPQELLYLYQRPSGPDENLLAWRGDEVCGLLTGTFRHDFSDNHDFSGFGLPQTPHALLTRLHVRGSTRRRGIGKALVARFAAEVVDDCAFIGGYLDGTSDRAGRRAFFRELGFVVCGSDTFGARPAEVLRTAT